MKTVLALLKLFFLLTVIFCLIVFSRQPLLAASSMIGTSAPFFSVESGNGDVLTLDKAMGKVLVIFYETKDVSEKNKNLKDYLDDFNDHQSETVRQAIIWVPVIDCSQTFWPITALWKHKMQERSKEEGITIYGDWSGKMLRDYGMKEKDNNLVIVDRKGIIRYFASGVIDRKYFSEIPRLLLQLVVSP